MADDDKLHRRQFFRRSFGELIKPFAASLEPLAKTLSEFDRATGGPPASPSTPPPPKKVPLQLWLRPPGALPEKKLAEVCSKCGDCVRVCPAEAIKIDATGGFGGGLPYIDADTSACVACEGLQCMSACPTGALLPTPLTQIKMGTAVWRAQHCTRHTRHDDCRQCVEICPLGETAIDLVFNDIQVKPLGCIGCGLCQLHCPTSPKAITVIPIAARSL